jgi:hypothetical protein
LGLNALLIAVSGATVSLMFGLGVYWKILAPVGISNVVQLLLIIVPLDMYRSCRNYAKNNKSDSTTTL